MKKRTGLTVKTKTYEMLDGTERVLVQQVSDGSIVKRFEKTPLPTHETDVVCPHFLELKWAYGCPFSCAWCYLKGTLRLLPTGTKPVVKDYDRVRRHLLTFFEYAGQNEILNTGELADSLMHESNDRPFSRFIMPLFEAQDRHKVLFLTKSNRVGNLLDKTGHSKVIVSFSLNADEVSRRWEKAPPLQDRIEAAATVSEAGFETRIRIDPMVPIRGWQGHYTDLIDSIFERFIPERITLGSLRGLQVTINQAQDKSWVGYLTEGSNWGKKIAQNTRCSMYSALLDHMTNEYDYSNIGLCKETRRAWGVLGMDHTKIRCNCIW